MVMHLWENKDRQVKTKEQGGIFDITAVVISHRLESLASLLIPRVEIAQRIGLRFSDFVIGDASGNEAITVVPILPQVDPEFGGVRAEFGKVDPLLIILKNQGDEFPYGPFNASFATCVGLMARALQDASFISYFQKRQNSEKPFTADDLLNTLRVSPMTLFLFWLGLQSATILTKSPTLQTRMHPKARKVFYGAANQIIQDNFDVSAKRKSTPPVKVIPAMRDDLRTLYRVHEDHGTPFIPTAFLQNNQPFNADKMRQAIHETRAGYFHHIGSLEMLLRNMMYLTTAAYYNPVV